MIDSAVLTPYLQNPEKVVVCYHAGCNDGFGAALVLWYLFGGRGEYRAMRYDAPFKAEDYVGRLVLMVDFSLKRPALLELARAADCLVIIDHHKSARAELAELFSEDGASTPGSGDLQIYCWFDMEHSGATMTFQQVRSLLPHTVPVTKLQLLLSYIEDRDLWTWVLPNSREFSSALSMWHKSFAGWNAKIRSYESVEVMYSSLVQEGDIILQRDRKLVDGLAARAVHRFFEGLHAIEVNSNVFWSELGERLAHLAPVVMVWGVQSDGRYRYELRTQDKEVDVSELARLYGGGGHKAAAGFVVDERV